MLEVRNLTKVYKPKKGVPVKALDNLNLKLQDTGMVFILGKSGSGKSTLLNLLGGLDKYDSGEIIIKGKSSKDFTQGDFDSYRNTYVGFIFQEYNILEEFTVGANIGLAMELQGKKATSEAINKILDEVDLVGYGTRKPNELSGGQMQRVAIARALIKNPEIIMADEPTGALDSKTGIQVFNTLKKLSKTKLVLIVSHDREFAEQYADRIIEFSDGKIISDVEKQITKSTAQSEGINIVDDSFIYVKKGYKLSNEDLNLIKNYLENSNDDVIISVDGSTNNNIKKLAKITEDGNREVFKDTDAETIKNNIDENNIFKLIKSRLPLKDSLKIGASGLRGKPIRLFLTILLSMISFTLFGLADTMGSYNKVSTSVTSIMESNVTNISFIKEEEIKQYDYSYFNDSNMRNADIKKLEDKLDIDFRPVYNGNFHPRESLYINGNYYDESKLMNLYNYYPSQVSGFSEYTRDDINELGYNLIGEMPDAYNEIAISKYIYEHFTVAGYRSPSGDTIKPQNIMSEVDLIGKQVSIKNKIYTISGVIDTQLNAERYAALKERNEQGGIISYILMEEFRTVTQLGYHGLVFVKPGFINNIIESNQKNGITMSGLGEMYLENLNNNSSNWIQNITKLSNLNQDNIYFLNSNKTQLESREIVLNAKTALEMMNLYSIELPGNVKQKYGLEYATSYGEALDQVSYKAMEDYANSNYTDAFNKGFNFDIIGWSYQDDYVVTESDKMSAFLEYLRNFQFGYFNNIYGEHGFDLEWNAKKDFVKDTNLLSTQTVDYKLTTRLYSKDYKEDIMNVSAVGYYFPSTDLMQSYGHGIEFTNPVVVDDEYYSSFEANLPGPYAFAIAKMPTSEKAIKEIVEFGYDNEYDGVRYGLRNEVYFLLDQVNNFIEQSSKVFLYIGIGFAVFSSLLLFNFITISISHKKREIGVLRALGSRSSDVFGIFYNESLIIALINFILALIATIGTVIFINNWLRNEYGVLITFLNFGIRQIFLMLLVSVAVATISSFLPVYRIARKKPIDAIRNR